MFQAWRESAPGFGMHVEVHDPQDKQVISRAYGAQGRVSLFFRFKKTNASLRNL